MTYSDKTGGNQPEVSPFLESCLPLVDSLRQMAEVLEGQVTHLKGNGWTDSQARAIVAAVFGWRHADGSKPEGAE